MRRIAFTALLYLVFVFCCEAQSSSDTIINRYNKYLWATEPQNRESIKEIVTSLKTIDIDINAKDQSGIKARALVLLHNTRGLSLAWSNPESPVYHSDSVSVTLTGSLQRCLEYLQKNSKWSLHQLDIACDIRDVLLLLRNDLSSEHRTQCLDILKKHKLQGTASGRDMILTNELGIHFGALTKDTIQIANCRDLIVKDIFISTADGIQPDNSFHHNGKRLEMFNAARSFIYNNVRVAWQLKGTTWSFPEEKINLITDLITNGWQWMARGINTVPGTIDHHVSIENSLRAADLRSIIPFLTALNPEKAESFTSLENWQNEKDTHEGIHYWPYSDFTAYHQPDFSFFVKTTSERTLSPVVDEQRNLKGHLINSGGTYLVNDGMEYFNLMPVWNWQMLPGVTSFDKARIVERQPLAGNVNNGKSGATAMQMVMKDSLKRMNLSANKFWAAHNGFIVCLVGGLKGNFAGHATTVIDQCRWRGDVTVNKPGNILKAGLHKLNRVNWIHHAGFVYMTFPYMHTPLNLELKEVTGNWKSINRSEPDKRITENIFLPIFDHGHLVDKFTGTGYVLARAATPQIAQVIASQPEWSIFQNSNDCQIVYFKDGTVMAAFYTTVPFGHSKLDLEVSHPCLILITGNKMYVTDLAYTGRKIRIKKNNIVYNVITRGNGATSLAQEAEPE